VSIFRRFCSSVIMSWPHHTLCCDREALRWTRLQVVKRPAFHPGFCTIMSNNFTLALSIWQSTMFHLVVQFSRAERDFYSVHRPRKVPMSQDAVEWLCKILTLR
jgi:hypothetical protein